MPSRLIAIAVALCAALSAMLGETPTAALGVGSAPDGAAAGEAAVDEPRAWRRPNIILITTDDMAYGDLRWMPRTRRLIGRQGTRFVNGLSSHPLCCPARAALQTGQLSHNNRVRSNQAPHNFKAFRKRTALPVWMRRAGYKTGFAGIYMIGFGKQQRAPGWNYWDPTIGGMFQYYGFRQHRNGDPRYHGKEYHADYVTRRTNFLIKKWHDKGKPFFIWASHAAPHSRVRTRPYVPVPPKRHRTRFAGLDSPSLRDPGYLEVDVSDKPLGVYKRDRYSKHRINRLFRNRLRSLLAVDEGVAKIVRNLKRRGELRRTYIVFTSDNGMHLGQMRAQGKNMPYQHSLRVPLLVRGPRVPRGRVSGERAVLADLAPTFARIARARPLVQLDGASLLPTLRRGRALRETALIQGWVDKKVRRYADVPDGWWWRGVTTDRYTFARYRHDRIRYELYDRLADPHETYSLVGEPAYAGVLAELKRRLDILRTCRGRSACNRDLGPDPLPDHFPVIPPPQTPEGQAKSPLPADPCREPDGRRTC